MYPGFKGSTSVHGICALPFIYPRTMVQVCMYVCMYYVCIYVLCMYMCVCVMYVRMYNCVSVYIIMYMWQWEA